MTSSATASMLLAQARSTQALPATWHRHALEYAQAHSQVDIVVALAGRPDAPSELTDRFLASTHPKVRVALLTRSSFPSDQREDLLRSETRASVLADAYPELPAEARPVVHERFLAKPTKALAESILQSAQAPLDPTIGVDIVRMLSSRVSGLPDQTASKLYKLVREIAEKMPEGLIDAALPSTILSRTVLASGGKNLSDDEAAQLVPALFAPLDTANWRAHTGLDEVAPLLERLVNAGPQVTALVKQHLGSLREGADRIRVESWVGRQEGRDLSPSELAALAVSGDTGAATQLLQQGDAPLDLRLAVVCVIPTAALAAMAADLEEPLRDQIAATAYPYFTAKTWNSYSDPRAAQRRVLAAILAEEANSRALTRPRWSYYGSVSVGLVEHLAEVMSANLVRDLPCQVALARAGSWSATVVAQLLAEAAVEDLVDGDWATYYNLISDWSGTVGELHEACRALSS